MKPVNETKVARFKQKQDWLVEIYNLALELEQSNIRKDLEIQRLKLELQTLKSKPVDLQPSLPKVEAIPYDKLGRMVGDLYKKYGNLQKKNEQLENKVNENKEIVKKYNKIVQGVK